MKKSLLFFMLILSVRILSGQSFHFVVTGDTHMYRYGAGDSLHRTFREVLLPFLIGGDPDGPGDFLVVAGDMDPFFRVRTSIASVLGYDHPFYTVMGNHDVGGTNKRSDLFPACNWQNAFGIILYNRGHLRDIVRWGPDVPSPELAGSYEKDGIRWVTYYDSAGIRGARYTTYSFDHGNAHFVVLDLYAGQTWEMREDGRIWTAMYDWLEKDLEATRKEHIFVFAHEPVWAGTSLNDRPVSKETFWDLLVKHKVVAYFCGHRHQYTIGNHRGVWEIVSSCAFDTSCVHYTQVFINGPEVGLKTYGYDNGRMHLVDERTLRDLR